MTRSLARKIIIALLTVLTVLLIFSAVAVAFIFPQLNSLFARADRPARTGYLEYEDYAPNYPREEFALESGKNNINCYYYGVENKGGLIIVCPGIRNGADSMLAETMRFVNAGYKVISFDPTGTWSSEGDSIVGLTQEYLDLDALLDYVESKEEFKDSSIYLYGFSSGGYAAACMLGSDHYITAAVSISSYDNPLDVLDEWTRASLGLLSGRIAKPYIALYNFFKFGTYSNMSASKEISSSDTPIMIFHGDNDGTVSYNFSSIYSHLGEVSNPNARFITCDKLLQNDHSTMFLSSDAIEYRMRVTQQESDLINQYGGAVPADVAEEHYAEVDYDRMNRLDDDFMNAVISFFDQNKKEADFIQQLLDSYTPPQE